LKDAQPQTLLLPPSLQGEAGVIRLLLRANKKLMSLAAADAALAAAAAADASCGARKDLRRVADSYGKTPGRLAWDMERWVGGVYR
jgi:hypothetical protein